MAILQDLPTETLILILRFLAMLDLQSTLLAQRVSRRFRGVIQDAVLHNAPGSRPGPGPEAAQDGSAVEINPLLQAKFRGLFSSADCFTAAERARYWFLTLDGDATLPFRRLPWAGTSSPPARRDAFLRPEASWRGLSPTFGASSSSSSSSSPPTLRRLDVVKSFEGGAGRAPVAYAQVELPPAGLSMALLYDVLLCGEEALYGRETGSWQLLVGKRLRSFDVLYRWGCFIVDPGESRLVGDAPDAAILFVRGGEGCARQAVPGPDEWVPRRLMKGGRPKFFPWQGPLIDPEETEWFQ
ncbi:hypothetical protein F4802DRAFT_620118 [Xylaria palmicola]|nr:hypothetical protein F4802DRAFT_620118 [Xylaria palmicola]